MSTLQTLALFVYGAFLFGALRHIDVTHFLKNKHQQHLVFGSAASLFVLWLFKVGIFDGLDVHFLGLSVLTLMLGFRLAIVTAFITLIGCAAVGFIAWENIGVDGLLGTVLPIGVTYLFYMLSFHHIPRQLFVYIFLCAFFPAAISIALKTLTLGLFYFVEGTYPWDVIFDNYVLLIPLLVFPEALLNGMAITLLVIYQPTWVYTFHDKFYLNK
ncbi:energy-coupling factor ABC transporter permease [Alteromonas gracilis]|uniref:energy-coupling factor ABC transporter permease n=1 Tax=Alteromonas gracilis TaxID=1479524 RepID=UPI0030D0E09F